MRQIASQARQLANDASDVKRQLQQAGVAPKDLTPVDDVVKALQALGNEKNLQNPKGVQELFETAVQKYKALEFEIRKRVDTSSDQLLLSGSEEVPPAFKKLIEEYSKALAKKGGGK
jgi:negative regulator of replication initiation